MSVQEVINKEQLVFYSKNEFQRAGYSISDDKIKSNAFDFIARTDISIRKGISSRKIITKVLLDLDLFKKYASIELQLISKLLSGFPLLVAQSAAGKNMDEATLYRRHDVSAVSLETLRMYLRYEKISKYARRGGIYVKISKDKLKKQRKLMEMDKTSLAQKIGLSRHSLYKYEKGEALPKTDNYQQLIKILGSSLDEPIDILKTQCSSICNDSLQNYGKPHSSLQKEVTRYLEDKEINVLWFKSEPFDGLSSPTPDFDSTIKKRDNFHPIIAGVTSCNVKSDFIRISLIKSLSKFLQKKGVWFTDEDFENYNAKENLGHLTLIEISDLEHMPKTKFRSLLKKQKPFQSSSNQKDK